MFPDDLLSRLQNLENSYYGDKEAARQKSFFDTYGARFSNNRGLGLAILNELDARGIDTSAADEAVQQILDTLRTECNEILESIKEVQQNAIDNARKVEQVASVVSDAVANNPDASESIVPEAPIPGEGEAAMPPYMEGEGEFNPDVLSNAMDGGETPPEGGEEAPAEPPAEEMPPAPETSETPAEPPAEEMPPEATVSDARMKRIKGVVSDRRMKRIQANSYKPSAGILEAASRGF